MGVREWSSAKGHSSTSNSVVDSQFRAWAQEVDSNLVSAGLARDTISSAAQADLTTASCPASGALGVFKIYELNDELSSTAPIYIKVSFGGLASGTAAPTVAIYAQCFVEIGTTVNASGVIGGLATDVFQCALPVTNVSGLVGNATTSTQNYISVQSGVLVVIIGGVFMGGEVNRPVMSFILERLPDDNGNFLGSGYTVVRMTSGSPFPAGGWPSAPLTLTLTPANTSVVWNSHPAAIIGGALAASADGAVQFQRFYHVSPKILPMRSLMAYYADSVPQKKTVAMSPDGAPRRYLAMGGSASVNSCGFLADSTDNSYNTAILWD